jgi:phosphoenolpyruvate phosphomutase
VANESELEEFGVNVVIYANQLLRSAIPAMIDSAKSILETGSSLNIENKILPIKEILNLFPAEESQ